MQRKWKEPLRVSFIEWPISVLETENLKKMFYLLYTVYIRMILLDIYVQFCSGIVVDVDLEYVCRHLEARVERFYKGSKMKGYWPKRCSFL